MLGRQIRIPVRYCVYLWSRLFPNGQPSVVGPPRGQELIIGVSFVGNTRDGKKGGVGNICIYKMSQLFLEGNQNLNMKFHLYYSDNTLYI